MNIQSLIGKFGSSNSSVKSLRVVVQPDALYFSDWNSGTLSNKVSFDGRDWQSCLIEALSGAGVTDTTIDLVLNSNLYQNYQIDKPNVPQEELSQTLPFLLKDLISEKVSDIVADAAPLPTSNKLQVYVISKPLLLGVVNKLAQIKVTLGQVLVEDDIWPHLCNDERFVLLQRSKGAGYRVSAFVEQCCVFQRTIRGITPPLTEVATSGLQLDGVALELQRSVDYLSSQLRGATLHHMKVCCDEDSDQQLAQELDARLSVKVSPLSNHKMYSGQRLAQFVNQGNRAAVNLYPAHLRPKVDHFTLSNVAISCLLITLLMAALTGFSTWQYAQLESELQTVQVQEKQLEEQVATLNQRSAKHQPSADKVNAVERLKQDIQSKQDSLAAASKYQGQPQAGYSGVMQSLAQLGRSDISLNSIKMDADNLDIKGLARDPQAIPNWVNQFKKEINLVGRSFEKLKITRNEQNILTFELRTKDEEPE